MKAVAFIMHHDKVTEIRLYDKFMSNLKIRLTLHSQHCLFSHREASMLGDTSQ